jgi:cyclophilin family peptidyl-prolyl cis-trans isomerase
MKRFLIAVLVFAFVALPMWTGIAGAANPKVVIETWEGSIVIELFPDKAPETVKNFLAYVDDRFYNGTIFHRVIRNFMIQGGGFMPGMKEKDTRPPIKNEADNGLKNVRGTIAMARTGDPHSATAQFFINVVDNDYLDHKRKTKEGWGYTVFGKVTDGIDVVDTISYVKTVSVGSFQDMPEKQVMILKMKRVE